MSTQWLRTGALVVWIALFGALDWAARRPPAQEGPLPAIAAVDPLQATEVTLSQGGQRLRLTRSEEGWRVGGASADPAAVQGLLLPLRLGVPMERVAPAGSPAWYGLDDPVEVQVEGATAARWWLGDPAPGGGTYLRLPGDDRVFVAHLGGRWRYTADPAGFRDQRVLGRRPEALAEVQLPDGARLVRGEGWTVDGHPADQPRAEQLAADLAGLRGSALVSAPGEGLPVALRWGDGLEQVLLLGEDSAGALAWVEGASEAWRISGRLLDEVRRPAGWWDDHQLLGFEREQARRLILEQGASRVVLALSAADSSWRAVEPEGLAVELREAMATVRVLSDLHAEALLPAGSPLPHSSERMTAELAGGRSATLFLGPEEGEWVLAWSDPQRIGRIPSATARALRRAWSR
ncbi:MAG: DUF4340 domain-containing protein [Deltaproteobacteria bacterium]|nr:DUF4340 domain-containing protein [Deltaproteobacteria bacterium]